jgi:hypothetical protein
MSAKITAITATPINTTITSAGTIQRPASSASLACSWVGGPSG